jgi:SAM-dependent methyltransferase
MSSAPDQERLKREREFHDEAFGHYTRAPVAKYYAIQRYDSEYYRKQVAGYPGGQVLEYGCGPGSYAFDLAKRGMHVTAIDISPVGIERAQEEAERLGVADRCDFRVMNAEELEFDDNSFDIICGTAILHHLDLDKAYPELCRTMRPSGQGVFFEPLGHNVIINAYRNRTPQHRTEDEHPLLEPDIERARDFFGSVETEHFHLTTLAAVPFKDRPIFDRMLSALHRTDRLLFKLPALRRQSWMVVITVADPRKAS